MSTGRRTVKDQVKFYHIALGSFREVECYIVVLLDLEYISNEQHQFVEKAKDIIGGLLVNFIKSKET